MVKKKIFISWATQEVGIFLTRSREVNDTFFFFKYQATMFRTVTLEVKALGFYKHCLNKHSYFTKTVEAIIMFIFIIQHWSF